MRRSHLLRALAVGPVTVDVIEQASRRLTPTEVAALALEPLIVHRFSKVARHLAGPGADWFRTVRDRVHASAAAMLQRDVQTVQLLGELVGAGIPFCLLKGAALRARDMALPGRVRVDTDLLVPRGEVEATEAHLTDRGYSLQTGFLSRERYLNEHFHLPFVGPRGSVEVHWAISRAAPPEAMGRMWARCISSRFSGVPVHILCPADHLLHSCIHISEHGFEGMLAWLGELALDGAWRDEGAAGTFHAEADQWAARMVWTPLQLLDAWGAHGPAVPGSVGGLPASLSRSVEALASRDESSLSTAVHRPAVPQWLGSDSSWARALGAAYGAAVGGRLRGGRR